jgi:ABC-2 type transport system permease protein
LFLGILCALSAAMILGLLASDTKGAQIAIMPIVLLVLVPYFLTLTMDVDAASPAVRGLILAIPFSHPFLASTDLLLGRTLPVIAGIVYEAAVFLGLVTLATRLFSSEAVLTLKLPRLGKPAARAD